MAKELKPGDEITWKTPHGETHGDVEEKVTGTAEVPGNTAKASKDEPQHVVRSDKSGKAAIHKPDSLEKH